ncbi:type IV pilus assembly protein PilE [Andreprevotia lacus DSM 23236]|jgi:type IV pilus assembly protein PilE|uniref:Type IV pilus assembly protein PilE n=1 Tax=Andreprevotia lacus DSM 23236 TaxID=1121001 RepID=A0A1W1XD89_9NEIS|nr:type IV pilin protein [Andreprevotia lacus]SMC21857.1 type IV pilus assembly protein PilE [Andreprevotia lacus DSM 23236]
MLPTSRQSISKTAGFTLIELLIAGVIVAILALVAIPSYSNYVRKGRRADAVTMLTRVQQAQAKYRANNTSYATLSSLSSADNSIAGTSDSGYYTIAVSGFDGSTCSGSASGNAYCVTATAVSSKSQQKDTGCTTLSLGILNSQVYQIPVASSSSACWAR